MSLNRRTFLMGVTTVSALTLAPALAWAGDVYHVAYPGSDSREDAAEMLDKIAGALGPAVAAHLMIARRAGQYVVIYDRSGVKDPADRAAALLVATRHDALLRAAFDESRTFATAIGATELQQVWNVRYGSPGTVAQLKPRYDAVVRMLGPGVAKSLVMEKIDGDLHELVYKRMGDKDSTDGVAARHQKLLTAMHLTVTAVPDRFREIAFDGATAVADAPKRLAEPVLSVADASNAPVAEELRVPVPRVEDMLGADDAASAAACDATVASSPSAALADDDDGESMDTGVALHIAPGALKDEISDLVMQLRAAGQLSSVERTAWVVHDLLADETLAAINADVPLQTASMVKPYVAVAFFHLVNKGKLVYGDESTDMMERMIQRSDNDATNWVMGKVGGPEAVQAILDKSYASICKDVSIVEYIPAGGCTYKNRASANDHMRLLRALWDDKVPYSSEIRRVMNLPGSDRLYYSVPQIPSGTEVYNKTGTTSMCCGDMGILVARKKDDTRVPYIIVGVIERSSRTSQYTSWSRSRANVIRRVSGLTYTYMQSLYDLAEVSAVAST